MSDINTNVRLSFKAFLSHRYKSTAINLYFFDLFKDLAEVQFEVDESTFSTNVTRLERMLRDAEAFIGLYPFPGSSEDALKPEELRAQSKYFRLEIDLAIRSQKPAIIFYDKRFGDLLKPPDNIYSDSFDINEITSAGGFPLSGRHSRLFRNFCETIRNKKEFDDNALVREKTTVGLIVPAGRAGDTGYTESCIEKIRSILERNTYSDIKVIKWPPVLDRRTFSLFEELDLALVDLGEETVTSGIAAYLHGRFIPMIRLRNVYPEQNGTGLQLFDSFLYGGVEVGYKKDMLIWDNLTSLEQDLAQKLTIIKSPVKRISTIDEARTYFQSAALRKEAVFLSYSGKDAGQASEMSSSLKRHFQKVFDYKDGESIKGGRPWLTEIFDQLSASAIGISLLSESYLASGNCAHEAQEMVALRDSGKMKFFPIKLYDNGTLTLPPFMTNIQYLRKYQYNNADELSKYIISLLS